MAVVDVKSFEGTIPQRQHREIIQIVFKLLDHFNGTLYQRKKERVINTRSNRRNVANSIPPFDRALKELVESIPHITLGEAAFNCEQYTRSLKHYEMHIRETTSGTPWFYQSKQTTSETETMTSPSSNSDNDIERVLACIQRIYSLMDEPDEVAGCAARRTVPDLELDILWWESQGNWTQAQIGYETLLRSDLDSETARLGWVRCLQRMGQLGAAWSSAKEWRYGKRHFPSSSSFRRSAPSISTNPGEYASVDANTLESTMKGLSLGSFEPTGASPTSPTNHSSAMEAVYAAASWRLGKWSECGTDDDSMDKNHSKLPVLNTHESFDIGTGRLLESLHQTFTCPDMASELQQRFEKIIYNLRGQIAQDLASRVAVEMTNAGTLHSQSVVYVKSITSIVKMHMLADIETLGQYIWRSGRSIGQENHSRNLSASVTSISSTFVV